MSVRNRLLLDVALFAAIVVAYAPAATGISIHEWLSVAIAVPFLLHLVVNWEWVIRFARNAFEKLTSASLLNGIIDLTLFVSAVTVVLSGFLISQVVARAFGIAVTSSAIWHSVHSLAADATIALLLLHFALHATWMASAFRGMLQRFDPQGSPAPRGAARTTTTADLTHPRT